MRPFGSGGEPRVSGDETPADPGAGRGRPGVGGSGLANWGVVDLIVYTSVVVPESITMRLAILDGRPSEQWRDLCAVRTVSREARRVVAGVLQGSPFARLLVPGAALEASPTRPRIGGTCGWAWLLDLFDVSIGPDYLYGMITAGCRRGGPLTLRDAIWFAQFEVTVVAVWGDLVVGTVRGDCVIANPAVEMVRSSRVALVLEHRHWSVRRISAAQVGRCTFPPTYRWGGSAGGSRRSGSAR
jgi:hypothetical protein